MKNQTSFTITTAENSNKTLKIGLNEDWGQDFKATKTVKFSIPKNNNSLSLEWVCSAPDGSNPSSIWHWSRYNAAEQYVMDRVFLSNLSLLPCRVGDAYHVLVKQKGKRKKVTFKVTLVLKAEVQELELDKPQNKK